MKRVLPLLVIGAATLLVTAAVFYLFTAGAWTRAGRRPWPMNLGTLEDFDKQFPAQGTSAAAQELVRLAKPLRIDFTPKAKNPDALHKLVTEYTKAHHIRNTATIDAPPAELARFLDQHAHDFDAVRAHLMRHGNAITWPCDLSKGFDAPLPNLLAHMQLARLFIARALVRGDWDDLHAAERLGRSLHARPDMISQAVALAIARHVNSAAWKLPPHAPPWFAEIDAAEHRRLMMRSYQGDAWVLWRFGHRDKDLPYGNAARPYFRASTANLALLQREAAMELEGVQCGFDAKAYDASRLAEVPRWNIVAKIAMPDFGAMWARVLRYEAEREVAANALRVRGGQAPLARRVRCLDAENAEGSPPMPLELHAGQR